MSAARSRDGQRPPLASSLSTTPRSTHRDSPSSTHFFSHRTPSNAPSAILTPSAINTNTALRALRNASAASSSVTGSEASPFVTSPPAPHAEGVVTSNHAVLLQPPLSSAGSVASTPSGTTSEYILRGIYNEKLHASVRSIITTLSAELPQDHIFLQLLADPSTQQYCKVRLAEVVEGFLYSTQAEQYHELATELARREQDVETQRLRIDELEEALAHAFHEAQQLQVQLQHVQQHAQLQREADERVNSHVSRSPQTPPSHALCSDGPAPASAAAAAGSANPMDNEEARRELLRVLEQATHDQELHRCRRALQAVTKVVAVTSEESAYQDRYLYERELVEQLYTCVQSLLQYVDGALDSQERLRREIQGQHPWVPSDHEADPATSSTLQLATTAGSKQHTGDASLGFPDYYTPQRPHITLGENTPHNNNQYNNGSVFSSAVSSHLSSGSAQPPPQPTTGSVSNTCPTSCNEPDNYQHCADEIHQRRRELQHLAQQLRAGQLQAQQVLEQLAYRDEQYRREVAQLQRRLNAARNEAAEATSVAEKARQAKEAAERLREESVAAAAAERTELHDRLADVQAQLATSNLDLQAAHREVQSMTLRVEEAKQQETALLEELSAEKTAQAHKDELLREQQKERRACQAELTQLKAIHQADADALQDVARELLCLRVEKTMAGLNALYQEAKATKADLLEREGYRYLCNVYSSTATAQHEAIRHAQMQLQVAETAQLEKALAQQSVADALGTLLRSMWADDATEAAVDVLSPTAVGSTDNVKASAKTTTITAAAMESASSVEDRNDGTRGENSAVSHAHSYCLPTTLSGFCLALEYAYANVSARHRARQKTIDSLRTTLIGKDIELRAAQANEAQLRDLLRAERAKEEQLKAEMAQLSEHRNPMRDLLARQDALLRAVSEERNALRRQWNSLSGDYIALEQRNGVLHARCAEKEYENARLSGMLQRGATSNTSTPRSEPRTATSVSKLPSQNFPRRGLSAAGSQPTLDAQSSLPGNRLSFSANTSSTSSKSVEPGETIESAAA